MRFSFGSFYGELQKRAEVVGIGFVAQTVALDPNFQVLRWTPEYRAAVATPSSKPWR